MRADATYQQTALMVAVRENHPDIVKLLVARGASVNARTRDRTDAAVGASQFRSPASVTASASSAADRPIADDGRRFPAG